MDLSNENVIHKKKNGIEYLQFRRLLEFSNIISHAYVLGLDKDFRTSMGEGKKISDEKFKLAENSYKSLCEELNLNYNDIVKTNQTHTNNIKIVSDKSTSLEPDFSKYKNTDGLVTNKKDLILSTTNADCILLLFFDPEKRVIANVHSGWRGTLQRISVCAVRKMREEYGCKTENIICCISPSIRKCHFEVDQDVYKMFYNEFQDLNNLLEDIIEEKGKKWHIDTVLINKVLLQNEGLKQENIIDSKICSVCNKDIIHSYRAEGKDFGLSTAVISLI